MQQVEAFGEGVDELLVLGSILTKIDLRLAVARILVVLAALEEVLVRLVVVFVEDGQADFLCKLPAGFEVVVAGMRARACCTDDDDFGMSLGDLLIHVLEAFDELR